MYCKSSIVIFFFLIEYISICYIVNKDEFKKNVIIVLQYLFVFLVKDFYL